MTVFGGCAPALVSAIRVVVEADGGEDLSGVLAAMSGYGHAETALGVANGIVGEILVSTARLGTVYEFLDGRSC